MERGGIDWSQYKDMNEVYDHYSEEEVMDASGAYFTSYGYPTCPGGYFAEKEKVEQQAREAYEHFGKHKEIEEYWEIDDYSSSQTDMCGVPQKRTREVWVPNV